MMRSAILLAPLLALAACNAAEPDAADNTDVAMQTGGDEIDPNADAGFEAVAPGDYQVVHADGTIDQLMIQPGMTWSMVAADGSATGGTIFAQGGKNCFVTEGVEGHRCYDGTVPADDGSIKVTGDDGEVATVRPVESFNDS